MASLSDKTLGDSGRESIDRSHLESDRRFSSTNLAVGTIRPWLARLALLLCRELLSVSAAETAFALDVAPSGMSMTVRRAYERMENAAEFAQPVAELWE